MQILLPRHMLLSVSLRIVWFGLMKRADVLWHGRLPGRPLRWYYAGQPNFVGITWVDDFLKHCEPGGTGGIIEEGILGMTYQARMHVRLYMSK